MLKLSTNKGTKLLLCGSCMETRGLKAMMLVENAEVSNLAEPTRQITVCDKVMTF